eukprot:TRINITY_DN6127_c0_g1_i1.p1 TRINITY_DN6127_c0_g1~~TRINITY_DN6127_c0_g1_i1.p1  ORF type:complete len:700 (-),score=146.36 TRINITY_DN6127_c0_g1_i1:319-2418(-)
MAGLDEDAAKQLLHAVKATQSIKLANDDLLKVERKCDPERLKKAGLEEFLDLLLQLVPFASQHTTDDDDDEEDLPTLLGKAVESIKKIIADKRALRTADRDPSGARCEELQKSIEAEVQEYHDRIAELREIQDTLLNARMDAEADLKMAAQAMKAALKDWVPGLEKEATGSRNYKVWQLSWALSNIFKQKLNAPDELSRVSEEAKRPVGSQTAAADALTGARDEPATLASDGNLSPLKDNKDAAAGANDDDGELSAEAFLCQFFGMQRGSEQLSTVLHLASESLQEGGTEDKAKNVGSLDHSKMCNVTPCMTMPCWKGLECPDCHMCEAYLGRNQSRKFRSRCQQRQPDRHKTFLKKIRQEHENFQRTIDTLRRTVMEKTDRFKQDATRIFALTTNCNPDGNLIKGIDWVRESIFTVDDKMKDVIQNLDRVHSSPRNTAPPKKAPEASAAAADDDRATSIAGDSEVAPSMAAGSRFGGGKGGGKNPMHVSPPAPRYNRKTGLCPAWQHGTCKKSREDCNFAHGYDDMVGGPRYPPRGPPMYQGSRGYRDDGVMGGMRPYGNMRGPGRHPDEGHWPGQYWDQGGYMEHGGFDPRFDHFDRRGYRDRGRYDDRDYDRSGYPPRRHEDHRRYDDRRNHDEHDRFGDRGRHPRDYGPEHGGYGPPYDEEEAAYWNNMYRMQDSSMYRDPWTTRRFDPSAPPDE